MKKRTVLAAMMLALVCTCSAAHALELPGIAVFSPGLKRLAAMEAENPPMQAQAQFTIDKAMYARDLSLLRSMLSGTTIGYLSDGNAEAVTITRDGELLGAYDVDQVDAMQAASELEDKLAGVAILERVPLAAIADWLEDLQAGDALALGFAVHEPFALERTMSDDGTRLTKIRISGAIVRAGEAPWQVSGYLRQPAGRAPKDTFELMIRQSEKSWIELLYSALRENEVTRKDKEGTISVRSTLKAAGKVEGYSVSSRLNVTAKNRWTSDGERLSERVTVSASLGHTDHTPGRRMQRLNDIAVETKHVIHLSSAEADEEMDLTDEITLSVTMDSNSFLSAGADVRMHVGGDAPAMPEETTAMGKEPAKALAKKLYRSLDEKTKKSLSEGL